jgi:hypothetical protein
MEDEPSPDEITKVLIECEAVLRKLCDEKRLPGRALGAFRELSARVAAEMERRKHADRRIQPRPVPDRRLSSVAVAGVDRA